MFVFVKHVDGRKTTEILSKSTKVFHQIINYILHIDGVYSHSSASVPKGVLSVLVFDEYLSKFSAS